jgi:hypothetical protein
MSGKMTIRDLIQFLLLNCELDDTFYGFLLTKVDTTYTITFDDTDVLEWIKGEDND